MIPFNKPFLTGKEIDYIYDSIRLGKISGNGTYTQKCQTFFEKKYAIKKSLLTTSCTDALEMAAILAEIKEGDEVIMPSYTFVSTALAFVRQGAKIVFVDSTKHNPNMDVDTIEKLITENTKAIVPVHYAGVACNMEKIMELSSKYGLLVIEDAAQAIESFFTFSNGEKKALGTIGHFGAFSFHETKNIISGEGGMLSINDEKYIKRSEIIWEKGTNRAEFFRGEINKYGWVDTGSSFLPSEIIAAFLWAQLENIDKIQSKRLLIWNKYYAGLSSINFKSFKLPLIEDFATNNGHMFYLICNNEKIRTHLIKILKTNNIHAVFHYLPLHSSEFYKDKHDGRVLINSEKYENCLIRLPLYYELTETEIENIIDIIKNNIE